VQETGRGGHQGVPKLLLSEPATSMRLVAFLCDCMPVETFVQTSPRTVVSYLVKPLHDQITKAFRENLKACRELGPVAGFCRLRLVRHRGPTLPPPVRRRPMILNALAARS
jgi:hypothetical protein